MTSSYTDSRGAGMDAMPFSEALEIVHGLAADNQLTDRHTVGDDALNEVRRWQQTAMDTVEDLLVNHHATMDELEAPIAAGEWPDDVLDANRDMDPALPVNAIKIVMDLGWQNALDPEDASRDVDLADEIDRQQQAFDVTRDLLGMHSAALGSITVIDTSPVFHK